MSRKGMAKGEARRAPRLAVAVLFLSAMGMVGASAPAMSQNEIVLENALPGNPPSEWEVSGAGDPSIQGFATDISVNQGGTVDFKINTAAAAYRIDIYRIGLLRRDRGAVGGDSPALGGAAAAASQAAALRRAPPGSWTAATGRSPPPGRCPRPPSPASTSPSSCAPTPSGASHIVFIVRDDASTSDLLFKTSDATWQAYNAYGGNSLYVGSAGLPERPRQQGELQPAVHHPQWRRWPRASEDWLFNAEYPMMRWLEAQRLRRHLHHRRRRRPSRRPDPRTTRCSSRSGTTSTGRPAERAGVEAARDAGVAPRLLQRQRGLLEDALGAEHRRLGHAVPHAGLLQGRDARRERLRRQVRSATERVDRPVARRLRVLAAGRRLPARERAVGADQLGRHHRHHRRSVAVRRTCVSGATRRSASLGPAADAHAHDRHARLRVGLPTSTRIHYPAGRIQLSTTEFNGKTHHLSLVPRAERRAGLRRRHRAVVVGARRQPRPRQRRAERRRCSRRPSTCSPTWARSPATRAVGPRPGGRGRATSTPPASIISFPAAGASTAGRHDRHHHRHRDRRRRAWSPASRSRPTAARRGSAATGTSQLELRLDAGRARAR